jgi:hypothetical protein
MADAISAAVDTALTSYSILVLAILYESQRARRMGPQPAVAAPSSPLDPPPPPGPPWG